MRRPKEEVMNEQMQAPAKKGLPTIAWVGIGCGALIVIMVVVMVVVWLFLAPKAKKLAGDLDENPTLVIARGIVRLNPDLEEVSTDKDNGTMTVRNTKTGEEITVNFEDIEKGRLSFSKGDQNVTIDASEGEDSGSISITGDKGTLVISSGNKGGAEIPDWVPLYPGTEPGNRHSMQSDESLSGGFEIQTEDGVGALIEYYRSTLEAEGFGVSVNTFSGEDGEGGMVNGRDQENQRNVVVIVSQEDGSTKAVVSYDRGS